MPIVYPRLDIIDATSISMNLIWENTIPGLVAWKYTRRFDIRIALKSLPEKLYEAEIFLIFIKDAFLYPKEGEYASPEPTE